MCWLLYHKKIICQILVYYVILLHNRCDIVYEKRKEKIIIETSKKPERFIDKLNSIPNWNTIYLSF